MHKFLRFNIGRPDRQSESPREIVTYQYIAFAVRSRVDRGVTWRAISSGGSRWRACPDSLAVGRCDRVEQPRIHPVSAKNLDGDNHWLSAGLYGVRQIKLYGEAA